MNEPQNALPNIDSLNARLAANHLPELDLAEWVALRVAPPRQAAFLHAWRELDHDQRSVEPAPPGS